MTAVLAAAARAVVGAVLLLTIPAAVLWAQFGSQGWPLVAELVVVCAVVCGCCTALELTGKRSKGAER